VPQVHLIEAAEPRLQPPGARRQEQRPRHQIDRQNTGDLSPDVQVGQASRPLAHPQRDERDAEHQDGGSSSEPTLEPGIHRSTK